MGAVAITSKVGVERNLAAAQRAQFFGEAIELSMYALEFGIQVRMPVAQLLTGVLVV